MSEGDLPVICELYVGYIDVHVEATQSDAALAASSSFKLILNGIRSACHNPQDQQQQQQEDHTRPREVANDDGFCFGTLIAGALRQMGHQPCPRTMHGGAHSQRQPEGRREMGVRWQMVGSWKAAMERWPEDKPNGQDFDFYALFPFSVGPISRPPHNRTTTKAI